MRPCRCQEGLPCPNFYFPAPFTLIYTPANPLPGFGYNACFCDWQEFRPCPNFYLPGPFTLNYIPPNPRSGFGYNAVFTVWAHGYKVGQPAFGNYSDVGPLLGRTKVLSFGLHLQGWRLGEKTKEFSKL